VWAEVKIETESITEDDQAKSFDYTFDYVLAGVEGKRVTEAAEMLNLSDGLIKRTAKKNGYILALRDSELWIDDFPTDPLIIIEVMTSSTSGSNKKKRSQIAMACEDAILHGEKHNAPGINYRQIWAQMVSQLIVKPQVGMAWGGKTIWLVQDVFYSCKESIAAPLLAQAQTH
jgi:hypothetical protein